MKKSRFGLTKVAGVVVSFALAGGTVALAQTVTSTPVTGGVEVTFDADGNASTTNDQTTFTVLHGQDGAAGAQGVAGTNGKSAYQLAVDAGYVGTEAQWLASLQGATGATGATGAQGVAGVSVTGVSITATGHLEVTLSNGTVIDAGVYSGLQNHATRLTTVEAAIATTNTEVNRVESESKQRDDAIKNKIGGTFFNPSATKTVESEITRVDGRIDTEIAARIAADTALNTSLTNKINTDVNNERTERILADDFLDLQTEQEIADRKAADDALGLRIDGVVTDISDLQTRVTDIEAKNIQQDGRLTAVEGRATALETRATAIETKNNDQDTRLTSIEGVNQAQANFMLGLDGRLGTVESEVATLTGTGAGSINQAVTDAKDYTDSAVSAEATARANADSGLQSDINALNGRMGNAESAISAIIDSVSDEIAVRQANDAAFMEKVGNSFFTIGATKTVEGEITRVDGRIDTETAARQSADTQLQDQIDALKAKTANIGTVTPASGSGSPVTPGNTPFSGQVSVDSLQVNGNATVTGVLSVGAIDSVEKAINDNASAITAEASRAKAAEAALSDRATTLEGKTQNITASAGQTNVTGDLSVSGTVTANHVATQTLNVTGAADVGSLTVRGDASVGGQLVIEGNRNVGGELTANAEAIKVETARAQEAERVLTENLAKEVSDRKADVNLARQEAKDYTDAETTRAQAAEANLQNQINEETRRAKAEEKRLDKKFSQKDAVLGAAIVNIIATELTPEELKQDGVTFTGTVGQRPDDKVAEVVVGVTKKLDNGFSVGAGVGTESGQVNVHAGWNHSLNDNVHVGVGASVSEQGLQVGPRASLTTDDGQFGAGVSTFGPSVIVGGVNVPVLAPQVGVANVVVAGLSKAYNAIAEKREAPVKELKAKVATLEAEKAQFQADLAAMKAEMEEFKAMLKASKKK